MPNIHPTASPLDAIVQDAGRKLASLHMTRIVGVATKADAENLNDDLEAIWNIVDPLIAAIGQYAARHLDISQKDLQRDFVDQLRGGLEGNATFCLTEAGERAAEYFREAV